MRGETIIVKTGVANTASVMAALKRQGESPKLSSDASEIAEASRVILPGVGSFGSAMETINTNQLNEPLTKRFKEGLPTLCICVGLQILASESEESPSASGMSVLTSTVKRFPANVRVPQFGWNFVQADERCRLIESGYAYFANSYYLEPEESEFAVARSNHGVDFVAAIERGALLACQFHLELSGAWGSALLDRWLSLSKEYN